MDASYKVGVEKDTPLKVAIAIAIAVYRKVSFVLDEVDEDKCLMLSYLSAYPSA